MSKESNIQVSTAAVNRKKTQGFSEGKKSEASRGNSSEIHKLSGPHMMKRQKMFTRTAPFWAFRNMAGEGRMVVQALSSQSAFRKQPSQVLTHHRGENKHNRKQETWNGRHDSSVGLHTNGRGRNAGRYRENSVCGGCNPRSGALPYLGTIIDLSDLPEQQ